MRPVRGTPNQAGNDRSRTNPGHIQTENLPRNQRYSYQDTPLEMQRPTFQPFSSPTNSTIDESPMSPKRAYTDSLYGATPVTHMPAQKPPIERTGSPYDFPPPQEVHPAYFAPVDTAPAQQHMQQHAHAAAEPLPVKAREGQKSPLHPSETEAVRKQRSEEIEPRTLAQQNKVPTVYNPDSLAGPNGALENHRPGQVAHPNSTVDPDWKHGICTPDALCCMSLLCPCMIYGKTQYRLSKKIQKQDPTDLLGYETCNGSCGVFAIACGFQCKRFLPLFSSMLTEFIKGPWP